MTSWTRARTVAGTPISSGISRALAGKPSATIVMAAKIASISAAVAMRPSMRMARARVGGPLLGERAG